MQVYADVRDVAEAHVRATEVEEAGGSRFVICVGQVSSQNICDILRSGIPELDEKTPEGVKGGNPLPGNAYFVDSTKAKEVLELKFKTMEETFVELGKQLLEIEKRS
jgi:nucleoside-diphosphate-sugar epimerase